MLDSHQMFKDAGIDVEAILEEEEKAQKQQELAQEQQEPAQEEKEIEQITKEQPPKEEIKSRSDLIRERIAQRENESKPKEPDAARALLEVAESLKKRDEPVEKKESLDYDSNPEQFLRQGVATLAQQLLQQQQEIARLRQEQIEARNESVHIDEAKEAISSFNKTYGIDSDWVEDWKDRLYRAAKIDDPSITKNSFNNVFNKELATTFKKQGSSVIDKMYLRYEAQYGSPSAAPKQKQTESTINFQAIDKNKKQSAGTGSQNSAAGMMNNKLAEFTKKIEAAKNMFEQQRILAELYDEE